MSSVTSKKKISASRRLSPLPKRITVATAAAMRLFGARVARRIGTQKGRTHALVVALYGDLGAGKTTFTQGFLAALGVRRRGISPTFLIIRPYDIRKKDFTRVLHIDCYRLQKPTELMSLGLKEVLDNPSVIVVIEWPELVESSLPKDTLRIRIQHPLKGSAREIVIQ